MLGFNLSVGRNRQSFGDADAQAFITATGLTGTTETTAVRRLVANLKTYGLWSKMKAIYPFVSDTYNLVSYSEDLTNASWGKDNASATGNTTTAPNGTLTADSLIENALTNQHLIYQSATTSTGSIYTYSCYIKANQRTAVALQLADSSGTAKRYTILVDLSNGTFLTSRSSNSPTNTGYSITNASNGWYRISISMTQSGGTTMYCHIALSNSNTPTFNPVDFPTYAGDGVSSIYVWGSQLELGSTMTTYQPIATTPANRFVSQFKYNLKDPRDLDAAFRLAFSGTWTYTKQGATGNGVNGYANSYFIPDSNGLTLNNNHISFYSRTSAANGSTQFYDIGSANTAGSDLYSLYARRSTDTAAYDIGNFLNNRNSYSNTDGSGYFVGKINSDLTSKIYQSNVLKGTKSVTNQATLSSYKVYLGGLNENDSVTYYSPKQVAFATMGNGLTDTEASNLYTSVQTFQQDLSRQVGVPIVSDSDAQSFLNAAVITDTTQANAINTLVVGLKNASLWTKMKAIYPFVGGTATTHKWNLKDPRDLDAAYRLAFSGAWTHSSTGALPNGANAYANTYLNPVSNGLTSANSHLSYYARTVATSSDPAEIANFTNNNEAFVLQTKSSVGTNRFFYTLGSAASRVVATAPTGFLSGSAVANTRRDLYLNGVSVANNTTTDNAILGNYNLYLAAGNIGGSTVSSYSNAQSGFASIGNGLTSGEMLSYYNLVQAFQTSLSRQV